MKQDKVTKKANINLIQDEVGPAKGDNNSFD